MWGDALAHGLCLDGGAWVRLDFVREQTRTNRDVRSVCGCVGAGCRVGHMASGGAGWVNT